MITAAHERAALSARRLPKKHGDLLRRWAGARLRVWSITDAWTAANVVSLIEERQRTGLWEPLTLVTQDVANADEAIRGFCRVYRPMRERRPSKYLEPHEGPALTVTEIHDAMRTMIPTVSRDRIRKVLVRANRRHELERVKRGVYERKPWRDRRWEDDAGWFDDAASDRWYERWKQRRHTQTLVFLAHYLLPRRASYRKARELGLADRTYFDYLVRAIDDLVEESGWQKRVQPLLIDKQRDLPATGEFAGSSC